MIHTRLFCTRYIGGFGHRVRYLRQSGRWFATKPEDPKYVFSKPPEQAATQHDGTHNDVRNAKYIFSTPIEQVEDSRDGNEESNVLAQAILHQRRKRRKQMARFVLFGLVGSVLGYSVGYKVLYLREQSFIPLFPASRIRKLSDRDRTRIDVDGVKKLSQTRVLQQLSQHEMIKEQYGVPLHDTETNEIPQLQEFSIWCEDQDFSVTGILIEPNDGRSSSHQWYRIPFLVKWRLTHRPLSIHKFVDELMESIGRSSSDLYQIIAPERVYGSFKYEFPLRGDNQAKHIWFLGEMRLSNDSLVVYKGKYHVDVKLEEIDLLRKEEGKLVRYILYREDESIRK
ncbi:hypothetical protein HG536_0H00930 [Torulaspora globosa]|uniref:Altered inheritance of mitochondria protein 39, mitochondrial n=1 Tax=Torulaspora globosa TaxID=48254 RepID=A0A7G3ZMI2_9SACH|nr:uncharacterized protein HG536_0H00930 [Torulaspora globosa]QLL34718.1 hypothetical protein HG536_0H00930 [Torulaspora globosa]